MAGKRHGYHHALAHTAAKIARIHIKASTGVADPHALQKRQGLGAGVATAHLAMGAHRLDHLRPHRHDGIERAQGVLEYHGDIAAAHLSHGFERTHQQVLAIKQNLALVGHLLLMF